MKNVKTPHKRLYIIKVHNMGTTSNSKVSMGKINNQTVRMVFTLRMALRYELFDRWKHRWNYK